MAYNEDTRVKIPAILHLVRLGYNYLSLAQSTWDKQTNIFTSVFRKSIRKINPDIEDDQIERLLQDISLVLDNEDLGQAFYKMLTSTSGIRLIDFRNFRNNTFHVVTELPCKNGGEEFRPDITVLINGMPLAFIEVKKPNNRDGILKERKRMNVRYQNSKFRRFINISQLQVFSNNMEYDPLAIEPLEGAFYATSALHSAQFNYFREEEDYARFSLLPETEEVEDFILKDNGRGIIKHSPEFKINKSTRTPTNRLLTSLFTPARLAFLLQFGIAYVKGEKGPEKHIMRYPQLFATHAIERAIADGTRKGIIWHTQGSGKTALAYFNVGYLTACFQQKNIVPKFYFIVDRLDLMTQAASEFGNRGLKVRTVDSKQGFVDDIRKQASIHNLKGEPEITVVNIQKFSEESAAIPSKDYSLSIQRVYFLDEVHRSYNPKGCFLGNLVNSDKNAIVIGLTGTPLIKGEAQSKAVFGDYIHKYYYNSSIADGYTLRLMREGIETRYQLHLQEVLDQIQIEKGTLNRRLIYAHKQFVRPMLRYILDDFHRSRQVMDPTIGAMVVCDSSEQAKQMFDLMEEVQLERYLEELRQQDNLHPQEKPQAAEEISGFIPNRLSAALILDKVGTKEDRRQWRDLFKEGGIDILFVYNMLLTGFDAKRLKKLYLGRVIKDHNLLQTLTRVNRPYKNFRYGFVVDFADIRREFDKTNKAYFDELQNELGDEIQTYSDLFRSYEEIDREIEDIQETLFRYDIENKEIFSQQIDRINDRQTLLELKKSLESAKILYNLIRLNGYEELQKKADFQQLRILYNLVSARLDTINKREEIAHSTENANLLNIIMEDVLFDFRKISEEELVLADELKNTLRKTREALLSNFDQKDPEFITLREELQRLFRDKNLDEITQDEMKQNIGALNRIYDAITELNRRNDLLKAKYNQDEKYVRVHKRIIEKKDPNLRESKLHRLFMEIKQVADERILKNGKIVETEAFFDREMMKIMLGAFKQDFKLDPLAAKQINSSIVKEYMNEYQGLNEW